VIAVFAHAIQRYVRFEYAEALRNYVLSGSVAGDFTAAIDAFAHIPFRPFSNQLSRIKPSTVLLGIRGRIALYIGRGRLIR
jgi:hypothetical protein